MIPVTILQESAKIDMIKEIIIFGPYNMIYTKTTNNMKARSITAISLCASNDDVRHISM